MLVSQTNPVGVELFSYANAFFCPTSLHRCWPREWKRSMGVREKFRLCYVLARFFRKSDRRHTETSCGQLGQQQLNAGWVRLWWIYIQPINFRIGTFLHTNTGGNPFNQNSNRSDREKVSTSKGGPVFSKLFLLDRTDSLSFGPGEISGNFGWMDRAHSVLQYGDTMSLGYLWFYYR